MSIYKKHVFFFVIILLFVIVFIWVYQQTHKSNNRIQPWHWRGIIPGETTAKQVVEILGQPDQIIVCNKWGADAETSYSDGFPMIQHCVLAPLIYEYNEDYSPHQIHFREDVVWLIAENLNAYPLDETLSNRDVVVIYGFPWTRHWLKNGPDFDQHLVYCEYGTIVAVNPLRPQAFWYFKPMSIVECAHEFSIYLKPNLLY